MVEHLRISDDDPVATMNSSYDNDNRLTTLDDTINNGGTTQNNSYACDAASRLTSTSGAFGANTCSYDVDSLLIF